MTKIYSNKHTMSSDIFAQWKTSKFIVAPPEIVDGGEPLVIMTNISYWANEIDALSEWCDRYGCRVEGMSVVCPDHETLTAFVLRWS